MAAAVAPHFTPQEVMKKVAPTVTGTALRVVRIRPNRNSFQAPMKVRTTTAISAGRASGRTTWRSTPSVPAPSTRAASSSSSGSSRSQPANIRRAVGRPIRQAMKARPRRVSSRPTAW